MREFGQLVFFGLHLCEEKSRSAYGVMLFKSFTCLSTARVALCLLQADSGATDHVERSDGMLSVKEPWRAPSAIKLRKA